MAETLAQYFVDFLQNKIPNELIVFIVSLFPILELRGGMIVAKLLDVPFLFRLSAIWCRFLSFCYLSKRYLPGCAAFPAGQESLIN